MAPVFEHDGVEVVEAVVVEVVEGWASEGCDDGGGCI